MSVRVVMAGGGTAGHAEPALATADALRSRQPLWQVEFLGTAAGIEARLVPARGYELREIPRVPLPRRPTLALLALPARLIDAVRRADQVIKGAACIVGFGGYVSMPAYLAARVRGVPIVVHEQNARAGIANRIGARWARVRAVTFVDSLPGAETIGLPLRPLIAERADQVRADRDAAQASARSALGLPRTGRVLLVTGGSQGSARINAAVAAARADLLRAGWVILHAVGERNPLPDTVEGYHPVAYIDRMDLALAAADLQVGRAGAGTCVEAAAMGLPSILVPLPIGNGEQELNARDAIAVGGAIVVPDAEFTGERLTAAVAYCEQRLDQMRAGLAAIAHLDAADRLAARIEAVVVEG